MCRALKILCAATTEGRLAELKRASVGVQWEVVGGATSNADVERQVAYWGPDVVIIDKDLNADRTDPQQATDLPRIIFAERSDDGEWSPDIREAIRALPRPGGPVRG
jgi:AmiR/NasT family two-component response regulator